MLSVPGMLVSFIYCLCCHFSTTISLAVRSPLTITNVFWLPASAVDIMA